jgi:hypothetical protein
MPELHDLLVLNAATLFRDVEKPSPHPLLTNSRRWADAVRRGSIFFYDDQEVPIGHSNIDWSGRHVKHAEWPAQLNRFFCLAHLCACYEEQPDPDLPRLARAMIEDWIAQHDYHADGNLAPGDNTLNLSIRLGQLTHGGWLPAIARFNSPEVFDEPFLQRVIESCRGQLAFLRTHLTPSGNWRISQLDTLLTCGLLLPGHLDEHLSFAVRNLKETFHRQIHSDGSHAEHNPSYHGWMCQVFTSLWHLAQARPPLGLKLDSERVARMWDYLLFSTAPDGGSFGLHDGGVWTRSTNAKTESHEHSLTRLRQERNTILQKAGITGPAWNEELSPNRHFNAAGQIFLRSGMGPEAEMLSFDATRWGGGHCHLSRNAINYFGGGRMLLVDPGIFSYETSDPFMAHGKSTPAHNTLHLDFMNQAETNPDLLDCALLHDAAVINCSYSGGYYPGTYTWDWATGRHPGLYGCHTRTLLWLSNRFAVVWDRVSTDQPGQGFGIHWQFPAGPARCDPQTGRAWSAEPGARNILIQPLIASEGMRTQLVSGQYYPMAGWLPLDCKGNRIAAPQLQYQAHATGTCGSMCSLLLPFDNTTPPTVTCERLPHTPPGIGAVILTWEDGSQDLIAASDALQTQIGEVGPLSSDASLVAIRLDRGKPIYAVLYGGMYLEYQGRMLVKKDDTQLWSGAL